METTPIPSSSKNELQPGEEVSDIEILDLPFGKDGQECFVTPQKKSNKKSEVKGVRRYKGSPKSRSSNKQRLMQKEEPLIDVPISPQVVEFDIDGVSERLGIFEEILVLDKDLNMGDLSNHNNDLEMGNPSLLTSFTSGKQSKNIRRTGRNGKEKIIGSHKQMKKSLNRSLVEVPNAQELLNSVMVNDGCLLASPRHHTSASPVKLPEAKFRILDDYDIPPAEPMPNSYIRYIERRPEEIENDIEYDLDEEDCAWLEIMNEKRRAVNLADVEQDSMEFLLDRLEKESYFQMQSTGIDHIPMIDDDAVCCICLDGECQNSNAILFCDMCNLAVHQECYGVPYIPEGQWLCRRCLQSPSRAVDCALCPNKGGAFKQTDDGKWAHVVCAIWIPEVCFANTVFLEPIDSLVSIPAARWRLTCYICKQKGIGACIQCHKSNCYIAFHVTCAQQANLCMVMDTVQESSSLTVKKSAWCDNHAPPEAERTEAYYEYVNLIQKRKDKEGDLSSPRQKMKQTRKLLAEKREAIPIVSVPTIPPERVAELATQVTFARKRSFLKRLMAYWKLKRLSRNGVPLLRRLQMSSVHPHTYPKKLIPPADAKEMEKALLDYKNTVKLRQDLEKARLLCELVRKREKVKRLDIHTKQRYFDLNLRPFSITLKWIIDEIQIRDLNEVFAVPVDTMEVPDYLNVIEHPMDLGTMKVKANSYCYSNVDELEADFNLMIDNCMKYNDKDTVFYKAAVRLRENGGMIIRQARREIDSIGFDPQTGMHLPERPYVIQPLTDEEIHNEVDRVLDDEDRFSLPFEEHITLLHDILDKSVCLSHPQSRKRKFNKIRLEINRIRRSKHAKESSQSSLKQYQEAISARKNKKGVDTTDTESSESESEYREKRPSNDTRHTRPLTEDSVRRRASFDFGQDSETISLLKKRVQNSDVGPLLRPQRRIQPPKNKVSPTSPPRLKTVRRKLIFPKSSCVLPSAAPVTPRKSRRLSTVQINSSTGTEQRRQDGTNLKRKLHKLTSTRPSISTDSPLLKSLPQGLTPIISTPPGINRRTTVLFSNKKSPASGTTKANSTEDGQTGRRIRKASSSLGSPVSLANPPVAPTSTFLNRNNIPSTRNGPWNNNVSQASSSTNHIQEYPSPPRPSNLSCPSTIQKSLESEKRFSKSPKNDSSKVSNPRKQINNTESENSKLDSFSVYRSVGDGLDSNSEDYEDEENEGDSRPESRASSSSESEAVSIDEFDPMSASYSSSTSDSDSSSSSASEMVVKMRKRTNSHVRSPTRPGLQTAAKDNGEGRKKREVKNQRQEESPKIVRKKCQEDTPKPVRKQRLESPKPARKQRQESPKDVQKQRLENSPKGNRNSTAPPPITDSETDEEEGLVAMKFFNRNDFKPKPMDLTWLKCEEAWYPGLIVNPETSHGLTENGVRIPGPPADVLLKRPKSKEEVFLLLRFDNKHTWEWIVKSQLEPLGQDPVLDSSHLDTRQTNDKKAIRKSYERAILHRVRRTTDIQPNGEAQLK